MSLHKIGNANGISLKMGRQWYFEDFFPCKFNQAIILLNAQRNSLLTEPGPVRLQFSFFLVQNFPISLSDFQSISFLSLTETKISDDRIRKVNDKSDMI